MRRQPSNCLRNAYGAAAKGVVRAPCEIPVTARDHETRPPAGRPSDTLAAKQALIPTQAPTFAMEGYVTGHGVAAVAVSLSLSLDDADAGTIQCTCQVKSKA